jgi:hypothetical protein
MWSIKTLLAVALSSCACSAGSAYEISCAHLYEHLKRNVRSSDDWPVLQDADACMSDAFIRKSLMHMNTSVLQASNNAFSLTEDSDALAELLAFSLIGRQFVQQDGGQHFAFSWNRYHRTLSLDLLPCEFSRPLYDFVLLCALLTILCVVVLQEKVKVHAATAQTARDKPTGIAIVGFSSSYGGSA